MATATLNAGDGPDWVKMQREFEESQIDAGRKIERHDDMVVVSEQVQERKEREDGTVIVETYDMVTEYKVVKRKVPKSVALRKKWAKFGECVNDRAGVVDTSKTYMGEEIKIDWIATRDGETAEENEGEIVDRKLMGEGSGAHCRICQSKQHWTLQCPYKDQLGEPDADLNEDNAGGDMSGPLPSSTQGKVSAGRYVPPSARDGAVPTTMMQRSDDSTLRITNLPADTEDTELHQFITDKVQLATAKATRESSVYRPQSMTTARNPIKRLFMAKYKSGDCKGYAFVTFHMMSDAEAALPELNQARFNHSVLQVEWSEARKPGQ